MTKWLLIALVLTAFSSSVAFAQGANKSPPPAAPAGSSDVDKLAAEAKARRPGATETGKTSTSSSTQASSQNPTLDDYQQERWKIKLGTLVPVILMATPVILLIVLFSLRIGGIRSPEHIMLAAALVLVIQATLVVSMTAEGSDALSASIGILGAIAGYLFGRARQEPPSTAPGDAKAKA